MAQVAIGFELRETDRLDLDVVGDRWAGEILRALAQYADLAIDESVVVPGRAGFDDPDWSEVVASEGVAVGTPARHRRRPADDVGDATKSLTVVTDILLRQS